jgi:hypothetical protein
MQLAIAALDLCPIDAVKLLRQRCYRVWNRSAARRDL